MAATKDVHTASAMSLADVQELFDEAAKPDVPPLRVLFAALDRFTDLTRGAAADNSTDSFIALDR